MKEVDVIISSTSLTRNKNLYTLCTSVFTKIEKKNTNIFLELPPNYINLLYVIRH